MQNKFIDYKKMEKLEDYASILFVSMLSLQSQEAWQLQAMKLGLLEEDEQELSTTIIWEIKRLMALFKTQVENIMERVEVNDVDIMKCLKEMEVHVINPKKKKEK